MARIVKFDGELLIDNVEMMASELLNALRSNEEMVVDLSEVSVIDTAAVQVLLSVRKEAEIKNRDYCCVMSDSVKSFAGSIGCRL